MTDLIPYLIDLPDKENDNILWSVLGNPETNQLYIKVYNSETDKKFEDIIDAPVLYPSMYDRRFGIDACDLNAALRHSEIMWLKYKDQLV